MSTVAFLLSKDPTTTHGGDLTMSRLLMQLVGETHEVLTVCLSPDAGTLPAEPGLVRVQKERALSWSTLTTSLGRRRSLVHARFDSAAFATALGRVEADLYVAEHSYMAEPFLRSAAATGPGRLLVNTHISESLVWSQVHGRATALEGRRIRRDELRVARAAHAVGTFDAAEAEDYRAAGIARVRWLDLTMPPVEPVDVASSGPRLVFLGDRGWPPNAEAADLIRSWWPEISAGIDGAELVVVGTPARGERVRAVAGVRETGFVPDLDALLGTCRALVAPIRTGGGVRVKILDAASRGLPVVATSAGIGSLTDLFGLAPYDDRAAFVARARALLTDADLAAAEGARLHGANADHWASGGPRRTVGDWLAS